jgi:hypothetical protein
VRGELGLEPAPSDPIAQAALHLFTERSAEPELLSALEHHRVVTVADPG